MLPPQLHLVGGGEARGAGAVVFHRGGVFKEGSSSLFPREEQHHIRSLQAPCPKPSWLPVHSSEIPRASGKHVIE